MLFSNNYPRNRGLACCTNLALYFYFFYNFESKPIAAHPPIEYP
jgi:hypothetical protein